MIYKRKCRNIESCNERETSGKHKKKLNKK